MSKMRSRRPANDARPVRRSLVELSAAASRAVDDALRATPTGSVAGLADHPPPWAHAAAKPDRAGLPKQAAPPIPVARTKAANPPAQQSRAHAVSDSTAEMMVKIAKDYQNGVLDDIRAGLNAALDHAKDFAETRRAGEAAGGARPEDDGLTALGAAAAAFGAEALELMQANVATTLDCAQELAGARTAAEFVALSGTQARKTCELMLRQADALKSFAQAVAGGRGDGKS